MYAMRTGSPLTSLDSRTLFTVAYCLLIEFEVQRTEDEEKQRQKLKRFLRGLEYEYETGMPAITQWMRPANEL